MMSVDAKVAPDAKKEVVLPSFESNNTTEGATETSTSMTTAVTSATADKANKTPPSDDGREARLREILGGPIRPFNEWVWRDVAFFKELRQAQNVKESSVPPANTTTDTANASANDTTAEEKNCENGSKYTHTAESGQTAQHNCALAREGLDAKTRCELLRKVLSEAPSSQNDARLSTDTTLNVLTPLLDNYTIPITRQGPEYFASDTQESATSLCIIMVGLPARGKTFLAQKMCRLLGWQGRRAKTLNVQVAWRRLLLEYNKCRRGSDASCVVSTDNGASLSSPSSPQCIPPKSEDSLQKANNRLTVDDSVQEIQGTMNQKSACNRRISSCCAAHTGTKEEPPKLDYVSAEHFRALVSDPDSIERRIYRRVLERYALDAKLFYARGGDVLFVNDDFPTEELRDEVEALFSPLATQTVFMEVIRGSDMNRRFDKLKTLDPSEYPKDVDAAEALQDLRHRVEYLNSVYCTLTPTPNSSSAVPSEHEASFVECSREEEGDAASETRPVRRRKARRYVKIRNGFEIEVYGVTGFTASRIVSYVMNLTQHKVRHPIFFLRHGESLYNLESRIGGDSSLSADGEKGAEEVLGFLASLVEYYGAQGDKGKCKDPERDEENKEDGQNTEEGSDDGKHVQVEIWTSQLRRAIQTVENGEHLLGIKTLRWSSLNEIHAGVCEDLTYAEVRARYPLIDHFRRANKYTFRYPEGESYQDLVMRLEPVIMELENADRVVVVVAHQAVLRALLAYFGSTSAESCVRLEVPHRTVWRCTYDSKGIASLEELNFDSQ